MSYFTVLYVKSYCNSTNIEVDIGLSLAEKQTQPGMWKSVTT
jgi:hypothetical protein